MKITEAVLHSPLRPSKAVRVPAHPEKPHKSNRKFRPTLGATIYQTATGTITFYPTTFVFRRLIAFHKWLVTDEFCDAAAQAKCFHVRSVSVFIQQLLQLVRSDCSAYLLIEQNKKNLSLANHYNTACEHYNITLKHLINVLPYV